MDFRDVGINARLKEGYNYTQCPECSHTRTKKKDPCLTVVVERDNNWWKCHHCGWSGNLEVHERSSAIREYAKIPKSKVKQYHKDILALFEEKALDTRIALDLGWYDLVDKEGFVYLAIPVIGSRGQLYNVKFRNISNPNKSKHSQVPRDMNSESTVIGLQDLEVDAETGTIKELIICEGETDLLTWKRVHKNTVSVPMGAPSPTAKNFDAEFEYLSHNSFIELLETVETFIIAADNDKAGEVLKNELSRRIGKRRCKIISFPEGIKDGNDLYLSGGASALNRVKEEAKFLSFEGIVNPNDLLYEISQIDKYGIKGGDPIGFRVIDRLYTLKAPYMYIVTGVPGSGKSTFNRWHLVNYVKSNNKNIALFTPEQRPYAREVIKMAEVYAGQSYQNLNEQEKAGAIQFVSTHFDFVVPTPNSYKELTKIKNPSESNTLTAVLEYVEILVKTKRISGYVIDAWNKMEHEIARGETMHNYIGKSLDAIINFNKENDLWCVIIAHPRKIDKKPNGNFQRCSLYHISDSAHWFNKADVGVIVHRDKYQQQEDGSYQRDHNAPTEIITEKVKFEELGIEDESTLYFDIASNSYSDNPQATVRVKEFVKPDSERLIHDVVGPTKEDLFGDTDDNDVPF